MITDTNMPAEVPAINRLRGFFAYEKSGNRLLDLYREGGTLVTGHRLKGVGAGMKNFLEKGNWGRYPGVWEQRAEKALFAAFPGYKSVSYFPAVRACGDALEKVTGKPFVELLHDPADDLGDSAAPVRCEAAVWRLFLPKPEAPWLIPWLPFSGGFSPLVLLGPERLHSSGYFPMEYQFSLMPKVLSLLATYEEGNSGDFSGLWRKFSHPRWQARGPYIRPKIEAKRYSSLFEFFLSRGILLSPDISSPSVLPLEASDGDIGRFISASEDFNG